MKKDQLVAVYGTLRTNQVNSHVMDIANGDSVYTGRTKDNFNLYHLGGFPAVSLAHSSNNTPVVVEVFKVSKAALQGPLDRLEGYPHFYNRTQIDVVGPDGQEDKAWIYHIDEEHNLLIESGDWAQL